ncbi:hypothetical protein PROFUN_00726 [Planoprotostelium fungivorum]|uniref:F-box domain-containing protein n=1 Tax=Planoprotostelium fungivorum TaxID=1890364 RepID=A0A2P6NU69_9EUKA|nr:hypothetical protein PROFUN_00726 [Planoprotostelium fungivorum]
MSLSDVIQSIPEITGHLSLRDLNHLSQIDRQTQELIHREEHFDEQTWQYLCLRDFHYQPKKGHNARTYRQVYRDLIEWKRSPKPIAESFSITKPGGGLSLLDQFGTGISLHGEPLAYSWPHCWDGSLIRFCVNGSGSYEPEKSEEISAVLNSGTIDSGTSLRQQFESLVELLEPGSYTIEVEVDDAWKRMKPREGGEKEVEEEKDEEYGEMGYFEEQCASQVYYTQDEKLLNEERVKEYLQMIRGGRRPLVLVAVPRTIAYSRGIIGFIGERAPFYWTNQDRYILDGHHKYKAYMRGSINPFFLTIRLNRTTQEKAYVRSNDEYWGGWGSWIQHICITAVQGEEQDGCVTKEELKMIERLQEIVRKRAAQRPANEGDENRMLVWREDWNAFLAEIATGSI